MRLRGTQRHLGGLLALALAGPLLACSAQGGGSLVLTLDQPAPALDPLGDPRLARLALYNDTTGDTFGVASFRLDERMQVADVAPGRYDFRLEGLSTGGQLLSLARSFDVDLGRSDAQVLLHLRKPLAYVAASQITVIDTAQAPDASAALDPIATGGVTALAATRTGDLVLAAVDEGGASLAWIDTATHAALGRAPLVAHAGALVVDPRDRYAAVLHPSADTITMVDLGRLRAGQTDAMLTTLDVPAPVRAAFASDATLWVVSTNTTTCDQPRANPGVLMHIDAAGNPASETAALPTITADVGVNPLNGHPMLALPCQNTVAELAPAGALVVATVPNVVDIAIEGTSVFGVAGVADADPLAGKMVIVDLASGLSREITFEYKPLLLSIRGVTDLYGNAYYLDVPAVDFRAPDLAVGPSGTRAVFVHQITYQQRTNIPASCDQLDISVVVSGFSVVDIEAAQLVYTEDTDSQVECVCDGGPPSACIQDMTPGVRPTAATVLMGAE